MVRPLAAFGLIVASGAMLGGQSASRPPVIDMHVHSTNTSPQQALDRMKALNIRFLFVSHLASDLLSWASTLSADQFVPGLVLPCDGGRAPISGRQCYATSSELPDIEWLRGEIRAGRIKAFGEVSPQYLGLSPADARLEAYWTLAEEFDLPVGVHMGPGPPGIAYERGPVPTPFRSLNYRMTAGDPLLLEEVLLKHKRLRLFVMHAGWPRLESMVALMFAHPGVYADVSTIEVSAGSRAGFLRYLHGLIDAGLGRRIMFGSDFPNQVIPGIEAIVTASILTADQKADILCGNAARFLRLNESVCRP